MLTRAGTNVTVPRISFLMSMKILMQSWEAEAAADKKKGWNGLQVRLSESLDLPGPDAFWFWRLAAAL